MVPTHCLLPNTIIALGWVIFAISVSGVSSTFSSGVNLFGPAHSKPTTKAVSSCFPGQSCWGGRESEDSESDTKEAPYVPPVDVNAPRKNKGVFVCWLDPIQELCMDTTMTVSDFKDLQKRVGFLSLCKCASRTTRYTHFVSKTYIPFQMKSRRESVEQEVHVYWSQARTTDKDLEDFKKKVNERKNRRDKRNKNKPTRPKLRPIDLMPGETEDELWDGFQ